MAMSFFSARDFAFTGILSGLYPRLQAGQTGIFKEVCGECGKRIGTAHRFRISRLLVVGQMALCGDCDHGGGVMLRSLSKLAATNPGFRRSKR